MAILTGIVGCTSQITRSPFTGIGIVTAVGGAAAAAEVAGLGVVVSIADGGVVEVDRAIVVVSITRTGVAVAIGTAADIPGVKVGSVQGVVFGNTSMADTVGNVAAVTADHRAGGQFTSPAIDPQAVGIFGIDELMLAIGSAVVVGVTVGTTDSRTVIDEAGAVVDLQGIIRVARGDCVVVGGIPGVTDIAVVGSGTIPVIRQKLGIGAVAGQYTTAPTVIEVTVAVIAD